MKLRKIMGINKKNKLLKTQNILKSHGNQIIIRKVV